MRRTVDSKRAAISVSVSSEASLPTQESVFDVTGIDQSYRPPRRVLAAIGRIIMSGAELDHLIGLALFKLTSIDFRTGFVLFDKTGLGTKIAKLRHFTIINKDEAFFLEFDKLDKKISHLTGIRNTLAHGVIMGCNRSKDFRQEGDEIMFLLTSKNSDDRGVFYNDVIGVSEEVLRTNCL